MADRRPLYDRICETLVQSRLIHPTWTVADHLSYLEHDAFLIDRPDQLVAGPGGPRLAREIVGEFVSRQRHPSNGGSL